MPHTQGTGLAAETDGEGVGGDGLGDRHRWKGGRNRAGPSCRRAKMAWYLHVIDRSGRREGCKHPVVKLPPRQGLARTAGGERGRERAE